ncbi:sorting nexin-4-like [Cotesia glomerata]|uniref:sorting nexin-4-like n=1 Tax=Cotesia glomerata TaxID=32391 RepID=UPI001D02B831|nr:sorting nexin-4-like [Cotesia glomerata]
MSGMFENGNYQMSDESDMATIDINKEFSLLDHMEISIVESEKRANGALNLREFYTVYLIDTKVTDPDFEEAIRTIGSLWRRYTEFEMLRAYLETTYPYIVVPSLPEKRVLYAWQKVTTDTFDPDFVDRRRAGLETFLLRIASHPTLSKDKQFMGFLQQTNGWRESLKAIGSSQNHDVKLNPLSIPEKLEDRDKQFESYKTYASELHNNLNNFLRLRARLAEKQYHLFKLHANYGRVFSEWSAIEKELGDGLQKTGHHLDSLAAVIDSHLEEEELIADQLKEWLFGASALQAVIRRREALQLSKEEATDNLNNAYEQRQKIVQGKLGLMSRLFGAVDSEEMRGQKCNQLEQKIVVMENTVKEVDENLTSFSIKALSDIERFQRQKDTDIKEALANYCLLQFKLAKKGLQTWQHIKQCLESMP